MEFFTEYDIYKPEFEKQTGFTVTTRPELYLAWLSVKIAALTLEETKSIMAKLDYLKNNSK